MAKILYIKANPKTDEESNTFQLANEFIKAYKKINPDDEIEELDLYKEKIQLLDKDMLDAMFSKVDNVALKYAKHFASFDKYIIASPMWNLSIPAILKAYIDYICYVGVTFKYTEKGPVGLLHDKDPMLIHIVSRGGMYSEGDAKEFEMGDRYIRTISHFMGIHHVRTLSLELTNVLLGDDLEKAKQEAFDRARQLAKEF